MATGDGSPSVTRHSTESHDATECRPTEVEVAGSQRQYQDLVESLDGIVWEINASDFRFTFVSKQSERILGYSPERWLAELTWQDLIHPEDLDHVLTTCGKAIEEGRNHDLEYRMIAADGRVVWIRDIATVVVDGGRPTKVRGALLDITERKRAEEALRQSEELFRSTFEHAPIGMVLASTDGRFLQANQSICEMLGYSEEELTSTTWQAVTHPDDLDIGLDLVRRTLAGEMDSNQFEKRYFHKLGHVVWAQLSFSLLRGDDGRPLHFISQIQDITRRKLAEEQLQVAREELESKIERQLLRRNPYGLTFRELTVLHLVAAGKSDREIGIDLGISPLTARKHISNILAKMGAASRTEAVARGLREGLLD